jgi:hypothetical protein
MRAQSLHVVSSQYFGARAQEYLRLKMQNQVFFRRESFAILLSQSCELELHTRTIYQTMRIEKALSVIEKNLSGSHIFGSM